MARIKTALANAGVLLISLSIAALLCEAGARLLLDPADYLSVTTERDDVLGIRIAGGAPGFDAWGFRNTAVPATVDVVAIGDSHTYGNNAKMAEAWPAVAAQETRLSVYNLGLGGYGPNQYYQLLKTRGLSLKPRFVVAGIYMGDDFENAFLMTYGMPYWSSLRTKTFSGVDANIWQDAPEAGGPLVGVRNWLSRKSIVYRVTVHGPLLGAVKGAMQVNRAAAGQDPQTTTLSVPAETINEAFRPIGIRDRLNQKSPAVQEGMRLTFELLARMNALCRENNAQFAVVVIPTKETVFAEYLRRDPNLHLRPVIDELIDNEKGATAKLAAFLESASIPHIDTLPALRRNVSHQLYTRSDRDMHPGKNGYKVIGDEVARFLAAANRTHAGR
jgi:hypothetical protein